MLSLAVGLVAGLLAWEIGRVVGCLEGRRGLSEEWTARELEARADAEVSAREHMAILLQDIELTEDMDKANADERDWKEIQHLVTMAETNSGYCLQSSYLADLAHQKFEKKYPLWCYRFPRASLALHRAELEEMARWGEIADRSPAKLGDDAPVGGHPPDEGQEATSRREREWAEFRKSWEREYPDAACAYRELVQESHSDLDQFKAIAAMPEVRAARQRDSGSAV